MIGESGTGRRRGKPGDIDIVFDDKGNAIEGFALGAGRLHAFRDRQRLGFGRIVMKSAGSLCFSMRA